MAGGAVALTVALVTVGGMCPPKQMSAPIQFLVHPTELDDISHKLNRVIALLEKWGDAGTPSVPIMRLQREPPPEVQKAKLPRQPTNTPLSEPVGSKKPKLPRQLTNTPMSDPAPKEDTKQLTSGESTPDNKTKAPRQRPSEGSVDKALGRPKQPQRRPARLVAVPSDEESDDEEEPEEERVFTGRPPLPKQRRLVAVPSDEDEEDGDDEFVLEKI